MYAYLISLLSGKPNVHVPVDLPWISDSKKSKCTIKFWWAFERDMVDSSTPTELFGPANIFFIL
jgi:hypothetical protein